MDLNGIIRGLFGFDRHFPNSGWQGGQDDAGTVLRDERDDVPDSQQFNRSDADFPNFAQFYTFMSDSRHMFEELEQQLEGMMQNFQEVFSSPFISEIPFSTPAEASPLTDKERSNNASSVRDQMLKANSRQGWGGYDNRKEKRDEDLDPLVSAGGLDALVPSSPKSMQKWTNPPSGFSNSSMSQSVSTSVRDINGAVEKKSTTRFSDGTEEMVITQQLGDRSYITKSRKRPGETEHREECYQNLDPESINKFHDEWTRRTGQQSFRSESNQPTFLSPETFIKGIMKGIFG